MPRNVTFQSERARLRIERLLAILQGRVLSCQEICAELFCDASLTTEYLRHLRAEPRRVRIARVDIVDGCRVPMYEIGTAPDAGLKRMTNQERNAKMKADPVRYARYIERERKKRKAYRAALPAEQRQRVRLFKDEDPVPRIVALLSERPGYDLLQIADKLNVGERSIRTAIRKLRLSGEVRLCEHATGKKHRYELPSNPLPAPLAYGQPKHSIFAALGL